jgi:hypothetical protein
MDRHGFDLAVLAQHVHRTPVGDLRDGESRDLLQRLREVHRGGQHAAGLGHEALGCLRALDLRDVLVHVDREQQALGLVVEDRSGPRHQPALLAARALDRVQQHRLGILAREHAAMRELLGRQLGAMLVAHEIARHQRSLLGADQLIRARSAEQIGGRLVGEHDAALGVGERDRLGEAHEDGSQPLLDATHLRVQARVVDRQRRAARELVDDREVALLVGGVVAQAQHRQRSQGALPGCQGRHHGGVIAVLDHEPRMACSGGVGAQLVALHLRQQHRAPAADHLRHGVGALGVQPAALAQRAQVLGDRLLDARSGRLHDRAVLVDQVDHAQVGKARNRQARDAPERRGHVE